METITATLWSGFETFARQGVRLVVAIALGRLPMPREFGIFALLYLFTGVAGLLVESGFGAVWPSGKLCGKLAVV